MVERELKLKDIERQQKMEELKMKNKKYDEI